MPMCGAYGAALMRAFAGDGTAADVEEAGERPGDCWPIGIAWADRSTCPGFRR